MKIKLVLPDFITIIIIFTLGLFFGWLFTGGPSSNNLNDSRPAEAPQAQVWTCAMHPQIRQKKPGTCPICGMDLTLLEDKPHGHAYDAAAQPSTVEPSLQAARLAEVQTVLVTEQKAVKTIRLTGQIKLNETGVFRQTAHVSGRIENLLVNFTGQYIKKGQIMAKIYSPELVTAQRELFEAQKLKQTHPVLYQSAIEKLRNWKLTSAQIDEIIQAGAPQEIFPIQSDLSGFVIAKYIDLGDHVKIGAPLFQIADLTTVWALFDLYEEDIPYAREGNFVSFQVNALPGQTFSGRISFIDPVIDAKTRVAKARIVLNNSGGLKPEMFLSGTLSVTLYDGHPVLVVPKTAVLWTGTRSVAYIQTNGIDDFTLRDIAIDADLGDSYVVSSGIKAGEKIVSRGAFNIDAAAQLSGQHSMMNP